MFQGEKGRFKKTQTWTHEKHVDEEVGVLENRVFSDAAVVCRHSMKDPL